MNWRTLRLTIPFALAAAALALWFSFTGAAGASSTAPETASAQEDVFSIQARRLISIPFGINSPVSISSDGDIAFVTGHGICPEGGESFRLKATVTQASTGAKARGFTQTACDGQNQVGWAVAALTPPPQHFAAGEAEACGMVVINAPKQGNFVYRWCKAVDLQ